MVFDQVASGLAGPPKLSGLVLALVNMVPIIGVMLWGWSAYDIVVLYWMENIIIGLLHIPRMLMANGASSGETNSSRKFGLVPIFLLHYLVFCLAHGIFIEHTLGGTLGDPEAAETASVFVNPIGAVFSMLGHGFSVTLLGTIALLLSHLFSLFWNYIGHREYRDWEPQQLMFKPYGRIVILHIAILFGAMAVQLLGSPMVLLLILIGFKTIGDFGFHLYSHAKTETSG